jgi:hypothetical protein
VEKPWQAVLPHPVVPARAATAAAAGTRSIIF